MPDKIGWLRNRQVSDGKGRYFSERWRIGKNDTKITKLYAQVRIRDDT